MQSFVSVMWGVIAAVTATMVAFGLLIAVFWAFLFGDHRWPAWSMPALGVASVLIGVSAGFLAGRGLWMHLQRAWLVSPRAARARLWGFLLAGFGAVAALVAWIAHES